MREEKNETFGDNKMIKFNPDNMTLYILPIRLLITIPANKEKIKPPSRTKGKQYKYVKTRSVINEEHNYTYTTRLGKNKITKTTKLPLLHTEYTHCMECSSPVYEYDSHHNERFCPRCGLVIEEMEDTTAYDSPGRRTSKYSGLRREEKRVLAMRGRYNLRFTTKEDWSRVNDTRRIKTITGQAGLNMTQSRLVEDIIATVSYPALHSRLSREDIILCVSRYVLKVSGASGGMLRFTGIFNSISTEEYQVVESNITAYYN